jgi:hypothetical protein
MPGASGQPQHCFRRGSVGELKRSRADSDAVLVGHSLGLRGVYTDPSTLALQETVGLVFSLGVPRPVIHLWEGRGGVYFSPLCPWCVQLTRRISETDSIATT